MERRKAQDVARSSETPFSLRGEYREGTYADRIATQAKEYPQMVFCNLMHHFGEDNFRQAYKALESSKALGSDGVSKSEYGENLEAHLRNLHERMRKMAYRPGCAKLVLIPKPDGKMRPIAISNFEDKIVQKIAADILTAIYDRSFKQFSFGFRPQRSCHGAIGYLYNKLKGLNLTWVVDVDLKDFFGSIDHKKLIEVLSLKISDKVFLRYITRMLKTGILVEGNCQEQEVGTPQGSIVSPILANIYLNHVLDEWFQTTQSKLGGAMVRYADDIVAAFTSKEKADEFVKRLKGRLEEFNLSLNMDKTKTVFFDRNSDQKETFDFLGFTFYWGKWLWKPTLKVKTSMKTLKKKIQGFTHWIRENRSRYRLRNLWEKVKQKLNGHYNYFGVLWNRSKLLHFYNQVTWNLFKWLNRRSQMQSYTWKGFKMRLDAQPLPKPAESKQLVQLTNTKLYRT
jgi:RNA-directed DNA polymerase